MCDSSFSFYIVWHTKIVRNRGNVHWAEGRVIAIVMFWYCFYQAIEIIAYCVYHCRIYVSRDILYCSNTVFWTTKRPQTLKNKNKGLPI